MNYNNLQPYYFMLFGTTSSGKTTFLNGLLGDRLLTSDTDEVSAGWVQIDDGLDYEIEVDEGPSWNHTKLKNLTTESIKNKILSLSHLYYNIKNQSNYPNFCPPHVRVNMNLHSTYQLLQHPYKSTFVDLPGIKTAQDSQLNQILTQFITKQQNNKIIPIIILDVAHLFHYENIEYLLKMIENNLMIQKIIIIFNKYDKLPVIEQNIETHIQKLNFIFKKFTQFQFFYVKFYAHLLELGSYLSKSIQKNNITTQTIFDFNFEYYKPMLNRHPFSNLSKLNSIQQNLDLEEDIALENLVWLSHLLLKASGIEDLQHQINQIVHIEKNNLWISFFNKLIFIEFILDKIIESDSEIKQSELNLKETLLKEFKNNFYPFFNDIAIDLVKQESQNKNINTYYKHNINRHEFSRTEIEWCMKSIYTLIAVDGHFKHSEFLVLDKIRNFFNGYHYDF